MPPLFKTHRQFFPDPSYDYEEGLIAITHEINTELLFEAYSFGIFPWPHEQYENLWFCPAQRGVLEFQSFHISRSTKKLLKKQNFKITLNSDFHSVIQHCAQTPRKNSPGTWITPDLLTAYRDFHKQGYAHSIECWKENQLVGGLYGVYMAGVFSAESMFHTASGASQQALLFLVDFLKKHGHQWMDIQMVTPHLKNMGGTYVSKEIFLKRLEAAKSQASFLPWTELQKRKLPGTPS